MKLDKETKTFHLTLEDTLEYETISHMLTAMNDSMLPLGWVLQSYQTIADDTEALATYVRVHV